ncbi:CPBP family intramembrane glutamic endopeptidase [Flagellimonas sp. DF-77]|uniref:CPBP family intramembrane glutamic endopeptidase n=1 Tax=Flagellimonas algarum TaxID=3230298 RepID=UPI0033917D78
MAFRLDVYAKTRMGILVAFLVVNLVFGLFAQAIFQGNLLFKIAYKVFLILCLVGLLRELRIPMFRMNGKLWMGAGCFFALLVLFVVQETEYATSPAWASDEHGYFFLSCLLVGLFEELLFRVFVFDSVFKAVGAIRNRLLIAVVCTALIFGVAHFSNLFHADTNPLAIVNQALFAFSIGILLQYILIRTQQLPVVVSIHAGINYLGAFQRELLETVTPKDMYTLQDFWVSSLLCLCLFMVIIIPISRFLVDSRK